MKKHLAHGSNIGHLNKIQITKISFHDLLSKQQHSRNPLNRAKT
ncbi:hypothetical protein SynROS8604_03318 [Synechococcus sp. ROS8604]|nr:hypothetical protein SynROS8604_03318 [Synechococcus sp. ROS8604]